ncbi:MAG: peptidase MA family metallohydrolase [Desulfobacterales bacterium]|nr:peptidase MA family metallohydrolase [Desulfobacterales bacterium]
MGHYIQTGAASKRVAGPRPDHAARASGTRFRLLALLPVLWLAAAAPLRADAVLQTPHVRIVHAPESKHRAERIAAMTPAIIADLQRQLGLSFTIRPTVVPAPNREAFYQLGGRPWFTAFAVPRKQLVVLDMSRLDRPAGDIYTTLKHEYAHLALHQAIARRRLPRWLDEGTAQWASDGLSEYLPTTQRALLPQAAAAGRLFDLDDLAETFPEDGQGLQLAYEQSRSFVNYLVRRFGDDALRLLLQSLSAGASPREAFEVSLDIRLADVEAEWRESLRGPGSWLAGLAGQVYGLLFFAAALATVGAYWRFRQRKRLYRAGEDEEDEP